MGSGPTCASKDVARVHDSNVEAQTAERGQKMHPRDFAAGFEATALHRVLNGILVLREELSYRYVSRQESGRVFFLRYSPRQLLSYLSPGLAVHAAALAVRRRVPAFPSPILSAADTALAVPAFPRRERTSSMLSGSGEWCSTWWSTYPLWARIRTNPRV